MRLPNGYGSVYKLSGNRRRPWVAVVTTRWTDDAKQERYIIGYYRTRADAMQALAEYHEAPIGERRDTTWGQLYEEWSESEYESLGRSTVNGYRAVWKRLERLTASPARHIKTSHLQTVIDDMAKEGLSRSSLEKAKTLAGILMERAVNDDIVKNNYARAIKLPPARKPKHEVFSDMEIAKVRKLAEVGDVWAGTVMILLYTGMRIGELVALTPFNVDAKTWVITGGIKTDKGEDRPMPVHSRILSYVQYWYAFKGPRLINVDGRPVSTDYYRKALYYPTLQRAGIKRHLTPHVARHTFATRLTEAEVQPVAVSDLMGHTDPRFTQKKYTHVRVAFLKEAIEALS